MFLAILFSFHDSLLSRWEVFIPCIPGIDGSLVNQKI